MIEFQLIDDTEDVEVNLIDNADNIEVELIKEIDSYNQLKDQPSINNVTLTGNKTLHDLGIQQEGDYAINSEVNTKLAQKVDKVTGKGLSTNDYTTPEKNKLASLENYDDTEVKQLIDTKQPRGNYLTEETDPTVPNHVKSITQNNIANWNNKQEQLISGTNIKTINNTSILGSGNIKIEGGGSDYPELTNKPKINNVELNGNKTSSDLGLQPAGNYALKSEIPTVPTKVSAFTNDAGYLTSHQDLTNYVTNTDYATYNEGGVVKISVGDHGLNMDNGTLKGVVKTLAQYNDMSSKGVISKGTLENVITGKNLATKNDIPNIVTLTQSEYDALVSSGTVDSNTYYFIM